MKKREVFKSQSYFSNFIETSQEIIEGYKEKVASSGIEKKHRRRLRYSIFRESLWLMVASYSAGYEISSLKPLFLKSLQTLAEYQAEESHEPFDFLYLDNYIHAIWLVSLAILLDFDKDVTKEVVRLVDQDNKDIIYEKLVCFHLGDRKVPSLVPVIFPKPYSLLVEAISSDEQDMPSTQKITKFLKLYYSGLKKTYWHNTHLGEDSGFFGYWCFELAAFVQYLDIDDTSFADNIYYPRDLTGKKLLRTWEDSEDGERDRREYQDMLNNQKTIQ